MEEKKYEIINSLRSLFGNWNSGKFLSIKAFHSSNNGFTLTELLIVIGVIGILAAAAIAAIDPIAQLQKARDSERKADLKQIQTALELYRSDTGEYPATSALPAPGGKWEEDGVVYINRMPNDPDSKTTKYDYTFDSANGTYIVAACAERLTDDSDDVYADASCSKGYKIIFYSP